MADDKTKILRLMQVLLEETDKDHTLNAAQIGEIMKARYDLDYNRKTVYADIGRLEDFGLVIGQDKGASFGYYIAERSFELPELKLLVDAVQSSRFITAKKSEDLIKKLEKLTSSANARQLQRQVYIYNRSKAENSAIYDNVDAIHAAIRDNRQIGFRYCEWTIRKELVRRKGGAEYLISPWALTWAEENYYLVGFDAGADRIKHYRVDKMQQIRIADGPRLGREHFEDFDLAAFARKTFGMYGGQDRRITLEADRHLAGVIIDRFGTDVIMAPRGDDRFRTSVTVTVSPQFFGWLAGIGKGIRISAPEDVLEEYRAYLKGIMDSMDQALRE